MKPQAMQHALIVAVACVLGAQATTARPLHVRVQMAGEHVISQYCAPPVESLEARKLYCRTNASDGAWTEVLSFGPTMSVAGGALGPAA
jgi:hypothetical protein